MPSASAVGKMIATSLVVCIGGPLLVWKVTPSEEELIGRYNPDLRRRTIEGREERRADYEDFTIRLREYSKSKKSIWDAQKDERWQRKAEAAVQVARDRREAEALAKRQEEMRAEAMKAQTATKDTKASKATK